MAERHWVEAGPPPEQKSPFKILFIFPSLFSSI